MLSLFNKANSIIIKSSGKYLEEIRSPGACAHGSQREDRVRRLSGKQTQSSFSLTVDRALPEGKQTCPQAHRYTSLQVLAAVRSAVGIAERWQRLTPRVLQTQVRSFYFAHSFADLEQSIKDSLLASAPAQGALLPSLRQECSHCWVQEDVIFLILIWECPNTLQFPRICHRWLQQKLATIIRSHLKFWYLL